MAETLSAYEEHRLSCIAAAESWERAAETARLAGAFSTAHECTQNAIRNRWLAEPEVDLRELFNAADRLVAEERHHRPEVPRD